MKLPFTVDCAPPFLVAEFATPQQVLSWTMTHPGQHLATRVAWVEVRNKDLPADCDAGLVINTKIASAGLTDAPAFVTSRDIRRYHVAQADVDGTVATCLATVGLSNAERVGQRATTPVPVPGTVNILVHVSRPLLEAAFLETMSIVAQARTTAILEARIVRDGFAATGTGTDCIAIAAPLDAGGELFAGLHTAIGEAVGKCTLEAMRAGIEVWQQDFALLVSS